MQMGSGNTALWYQPGAQLQIHTDGGLGGWLVLFSVGSTVKFHVGGYYRNHYMHGAHNQGTGTPYGGDIVDFESGDALVFRGATVPHGVVETLGHATYKGEESALDADLEQKLLGRYRVSVQARQQH